MKFIKLSSLLISLLFLVTGCGDDEEEIENGGTVTGSELIKNIGIYNYNKVVVDANVLKSNNRDDLKIIEEFNSIQTLLNENKGKRFKFKCEVGSDLNLQGNFKNLKCYPSSFWLNSERFESRLKSKSSLILLNGTVVGEKILSNDRIDVVATFSSVETSKIAERSVRMYWNNKLEKDIYNYGAKIIFKNAEIKRQ